ncbi:MAG: rhodanese-like domain-containing protein [Acidobacteriaceae bacterium]
METSACVRKAERAAKKQGAGALLIAKFVPGLNLMVPPLAGQGSMHYEEFLLYDAAGSLFWGVPLVLVGRFFGDAMQRNHPLFHWMGHVARGAFLLAVVAWVLYKIWKKQSYLRKFRASRVDPQYLKAKLDHGGSVYIIDLRPVQEFQDGPRVLPGATRFLPEELTEHREEIPHDREIFTYCNCPNERPSVKAALALQKMGFIHIHPVRGGFGAWKNLGYPLMEVAEQLDPGWIENRASLRS